MSGRGRRNRPAVRASTETAEGFIKLFRPTNKITHDPAAVIDPSNLVHVAIGECIAAIRKGNANSALVSVPDLTVMEVPSNFYSGSNNVSNLLATMEAEYSVMCGFVHASPSSFVAIVGLLRPRRAAELKIMATIENKQRGFYSQKFVRDGKRVASRDWLVSTEGFDTDTVLIAENDLSFALGHKGSIRKKLAVASGCILEYVGEVAYLSGTLVERTRGRDYLKWVLQQLAGEVNVGDYSRRMDISAITLTKRAAGFVNGNKGKVLRTVEEMTGTFCFIGRPSGRDSKPLLVCGHPGGRDAAVFILEKYIKEHQANDWANDAVEASLSTEMSKPSLEAMLKANGITGYRPAEPWKIGSNDASAYKFVSQPCPGAARMDTTIVTDTSSSVLLTSPAPSARRAEKSSAQFVNDDSSFPQLGQAPKTDTDIAEPPAAPAPIPPSPPKAPSPPSPPSPPESPPSTVDSGIYIDFEKGQAWGDWGLGPNGDPELGKSSQWSGKNATQTPKLSAPKLIGAWK